MPLERGLELLQSASGVSIAYSPSRLPSGRVVTCDCTTVTVGEALQTILAGTRFDVVLIGDQVVIRAAEVETPTPGSRRAETANALVAGLVFDVERQTPVAGAQVYIASWNIATLSQSNGRYLFRNIPPGTYTVSVERIGYRPLSRQVTFVPGETVVADFELYPETLELDEIIVTGTAGGMQRRAIGNRVASVDAEARQFVMPSRSVQEVLGSIEPGVHSLRPQSQVGVGGQIRIRGVSSFDSDRSTPVVFVDGIRVSTEVTGPRFASASAPREQFSLDDFPASEIERIEIIKGPAAATLYGSEASAGVIQIITKRGRAGAPEFDISTSVGTNWVVHPSEKVGEQWGVSPLTGDTIGVNNYDRWKQSGGGFDYGLMQTHTVSVRGGSNVARYFLSLDRTNDQGYVPDNYNRKTGLRANITAFPHPELSLDVSAGWVQGHSRFADQYVGTLVQGNPNSIGTPLDGYNGRPPNLIPTTTPEKTRSNTRFTISGTLTHTPFDAFTQRLVVGLDRPIDESTVFSPLKKPEDYFGSETGELRIDREQFSIVSVDYGAGLSYGLGLIDGIGMKTSIGAQYQQSSEDILIAEAMDFATPFVRTISSASTRRSMGTTSALKTLGMYVQQEISIDDRIFFTGALRGDDSSAFGARYNAAIYPKLSATWSVSDESFWRWDFVNSLRLRTAWGRAGRQPDRFARYTIYTPTTGFDGNPSVTTGTAGNPNLGPEISTELEFGFDASAFDDRLSVVYTHFGRVLKDAILDEPLSPSLGLGATRTENLGSLASFGWELQVDGQAIETRNFGLELGVGITRVQNRIEDLGGVTENNTLRVGFPYPVLAVKYVTHAEWLDGVVGGPVTNIQCDSGAGSNGYFRGGPGMDCADAPNVLLGPREPTWNWTFNTSLRLGGSVRIDALVNMVRGNYLSQAAHLGLRHDAAQNSWDLWHRVEGNNPVYWAYRDIGVAGTTFGSWYKGDFAKLREVSLTYQLPGALMRDLGVTRASLNLAGRGLWTIWQSQYNASVTTTRIYDPEAQGPTQNGTIRIFFPSATFAATLRVTF